MAVVDVYSEWCGACVAMRPILRRIKTEIGDDKLRFAEVRAGVCTVYVCV